MALRLRYEIDTPLRLREHVHMVDGAGYFFYPGAEAPQGTLATLEVTFSSSDQVALLRGWIWARPSGGGIWLELFGAELCLERLCAGQRRNDLRVGSEQLVLVEAEGLPALLCRLHDVSVGGARLAAASRDAGTVGRALRVALPEAGPFGAQLEASGRVTWAGEGEVGVCWDRGDLFSRVAVRRLLQLAAEEWEGAPTAMHPRSCRCLSREKEGPEVLLLG